LISKIRSSERIEGFGKESKVFKMLYDLKLNPPIGKDVIDLTIGAPDAPPEPEIVEEMRHQLLRKDVHSYGSGAGLPVLRENIAKWYVQRFGVQLSPEEEVLVVMGAKRTLIDVATNFVNPGQFVLLPDVGYPTNKIAALLAGGIPYYMKLISERGYQPDFASIPTGVLQNAALMILNYPNNPTSALGTDQTFKTAIAAAEEHGFIICHDNPYSEITFDGKIQHSFLEYKGASSVGVELFSFSKVFNMAGWRVACLVGNRKIIQIMRDAKSNYDSGIFDAIQLAAAKAMSIYAEKHIQQRQSSKYQHRRDVAMRGLNNVGWRYFIPQGGLYIWAKPPVGDTVAFAKRLYQETGVLVTPGEGYGPGGKGWVRIALVHDEQTLTRAFTEISNANPRALY